MTALDLEPRLEEPLQISPTVALESSDEEGVTIFQGSTASRLRVSRPLYDLLLRFAEPIPASSVIPEDLREEVLPWLERLIAAGVLERKDARTEVPEIPERRLRAVARTLFHSPAHFDGDSPADVSAVGVPYEWGNRGLGGMSDAPLHIRERSFDFDYRLDVRTERPMGWYDVARGERILEGITLSDWGDLWFTYGENPSTIHDRIHGVCADIIDAGSFPLFIGGDQSISVPVVRAIQEREEIAVLYFDAHTDFADLGPGGAVNHTNAARCIHAMREGVVQLVQVGHRGFTVSDKVGKLPPRLGRVTAERFRRQGPGSVLELLPEGVPCYVSFDVNCLDPVYAPGTSLPAPGGLSPDAVQSMLWALGEHRRIVGMDLVEVNPSRDPGWLTLMTVCHLLLTGLAAAMRSRGVS